MNLLHRFLRHRVTLLSLLPSAFLICTLALLPAKTAQAFSETNDFDWVVYVKDTQKMKGPLQEPITIDFEAVNTSGNIVGEYIGSAVMTFGKDLGEVSAKVVSTSTNLRFTLNPSGPKNQHEYSGQGSMTMVTVGTGTADGQSSSRTFESTRPISLTVDKTQVELVVTYPKGTVTYHGYIIGEGKGTHKAKMEKQQREPAKREKSKRPKKATPKPQADEPELAPLQPIRDDQPELAPLKPIPDDTPELAPLKPIPGDNPELAPLAPIRDEGPELAPLKPVTEEGIELAPLPPITK